MGDSDDEYDKKRRDKFRGERTESYRGDRSTDDRRRGDWFERDAWSSRSRSRPDYRSSARERYTPPRSHEISQPIKRARTDWEDRRSTYSHEGSSGYGTSYSAPWSHDAFAVQHSYSFPTASRNREVIAASSNSTDTQPPMLTLKAFLQTQDDTITDEEAIKKYNEYKAEFRRQQLNEFFIAHKDEEWFKMKYHPEESVKRKEEHLSNLKSRVAVFLEFLETGRFNGVSIDIEESDSLVKVFDMVTIRLEGGTEFDFKSLDTPPQSPKVTKVEDTTVPESTEPQPDIVKTEKLDDNQEPIPEQDAQTKETSNGSTEIEDKKPLEGKDGDTPLTDQPVSPKHEENETDEQKKSASPASSGFSSDDSREERENDTDMLSPKKIKEGGDNGDDESKKKSIEITSRKRKRSESPEASKRDDVDDNIESIPKPGDTPPEENNKDKRKRRDSQDSRDDDSKSDVEEISDKEDTDDEHKKSASDSSSDSEDEGKAKKAKEPKPRALHKTVSIFLRNLAPTVTKQEIESICQRFPGFMRVAIADPQPERKWFRRGWITFQGHVDIKDICWNFNNLRLRDFEVLPIVNRTLSRRIRNVSGITYHKQIIRHDIKLSSRIIYNLDSRYGLWIDEQDKDKVTHDVISIKLSKNPILNNITEYLIEEAPAEEEELLGISDEQEEGQLPDDTCTVDKDNPLVKVLDRLLFYLRIVHSIDYYNHCEYPSEDEMPNRCGLMHARGPPPTTKVTNQEVMEYINNFEQKISPFLQPYVEVTGEELTELGCKDPDAEVEKFIQSNTQELAKDKWLCPLSGKKFKGPEFVRKHILNKHAEKVEEVKKEVEYFNNYLKDPKRPQLPEHPGNKVIKKEAPERESFVAPMPYMPHYQYGYPQAGYAHPMYGGYGYGHGYGQMGYGRANRGFGNRGRSDYRPIIHYRDLDAPRESEDFL